MALVDRHRSAFVLLRLTGLTRTRPTIRVRSPAVRAGRSGGPFGAPHHRRGDHRAGILQRLAKVRDGMAGMGRGPWREAHRGGNQLGELRSPALDVPLATDRLAGKQGRSCG